MPYLLLSLNIFIVFSSAPCIISVSFKCLVPMCLFWSLLLFLLFYLFSSNIWQTVPDRLEWGILCLTRLVSGGGYCSMIGKGPHCFSGQPLNMNTFLRRVHTSHFLSDGVRLAADVRSWAEEEAG